jgi:hypothetical protein
VTLVWTPGYDDGSTYTPGKLVLKKDSVAATDTNINEVSLLLHGDGTNGSTTITDSSPTPKTVTAVGNAQISTAQSKFGGASIAFDGTGDYLTVPDNADFEYGSGNFTAEAWVYPVASPNEPVIMGQWDGVGGGTGLSWVIVLSDNSSRNLRFLVSTDGSTPAADSVSSSPLTLNAWSHVALVRSGDVFTAYLNGTSAVSYTISAGASLFNATNVITVGASSTANLPFNGYIDDLRITKGVARYTAAFTPPTTPFPDR